jgi:opacity protein-like surface antigen
MSTTRTTAVCTAVVLALASVAAAAADVQVTCEKRAHRSKISVDGSSLNGGMYRAVAKSGDHSRRSDLQQAVGDEAQFDFDSNPNDIADGATPIPAGFIVNGRAKGWIVNANGVRVTPIKEAICRVRN